MTDKEILEYFFDENNKPISSRFKIHNIETNKELSEYLKNRYSDSLSYKETINRIKYHIDIRPKCLTCGGTVDYLIGDKFRKYCSYKCMNTNKNKIQLGLDSIYKKFSKDNYNNRKKYKKTCIEKFGTDHPWKNKEIFDKCHITCLKNNGFAYTLQNKNYLDKVIKLSHTKEAELKKDITCINKYGDRIPSKTLLVRNKLKDIWAKPETKIKAYLTKKRNHSFGPQSKIESIVYLYLSLEYPDTIRQYRDENRYPYNCDFYIPSLDLFIEYQGYYTHGTHPFNKNDKNDLDLLKSLRIKYKEFYDKYGYENQIITTWIDRDVRKRKCAKEHNLNYIEFFNFKDFINWLNGYD